jgi:hypothetical protein
MSNGQRFWTRVINRLSHDLDLDISLNIQELKSQPKMPFQPGVFEWLIQLIEETFIQQGTGTDTDTDTDTDADADTDTALLDIFKSLNMPNDIAVQIKPLLEDVNKIVHHINYHDLIGGHLYDDERGIIYLTVPRPV